MQKPSSMNNKIKIIAVGISFLLLLYSIFEAYNISKQQKQINELSQTYADINAINYGLFNMQEWKNKAFNVFNYHITQFNISPKAFEEAELELKKYLYKIHDDYIVSGNLFNKIFEDAEKNEKVNKVMLRMFKENVGVQIEALKIKEHIPGMAKTLAIELKNQEPRFKEIMQQELKNLLQYNDKYSYTDPRSKVFETFNCTDIKCTNEKINAQLSTLRSTQKTEIYKLTFTILFSILLLSVFIKTIGNKMWVAMITLISILLLITGITMPMIVIDARINSFVFNLFESDLEFTEQVVFYQSKSIVDVAQNLLESKGYDLKLVGLLVICFSVIFPLIKLCLSGFYLQSEKLRNSKLVQNMIFYLGKWSMADVFVVALFMTYIGFYGLFNAQLGLIEQNKGGFAVETVNYTHLAPGALLFTAYCVLSIVLGIVIGRVEKE